MFRLSDRARIAHSPCDNFVLAKNCGDWLTVWIESHGVDNPLFGFDRPHSLPVPRLLFKDCKSGFRYPLPWNEDRIPNPRSTKCVKAHVFW